MDYVLDLHSHSLASGHAYNTIREMAQAAAGKGLEMLGITEHGVAMPGSCNIVYFENYKILDRSFYGVDLLFGVELNIIDTNGTVDMDETLIKKMDVVIASMHTICFSSKSRNENTETYIQVMKNPYINIIGHPDDGHFPVDYEGLVQAAKDHQILLEVNNASLDPRCNRLNGEENINAMLNYCKKYQVPVIINSDSHTDSLIGSHAYAEALMRKIDFPDDLVVNRSAAAAKPFINRYK